MRKTLALAGAIAIAVGMGGFASPAAAGQSAIQANEDIKVVEVGVELSTLNVTGDFAELESFEATSTELNQYRLLGCTASTSSPLDLVLFGVDDNIDGSNGKYLTANSSFSSSSAVEDISFETSADTILAQPDGGIFMVDDADNVLHAVAWGEPEPDCMPNSGVETAPAPTSSQSIERQSDGTWERVTPNPENSTP